MLTGGNPVNAVVMRLLSRVMDVFGETDPLLMPSFLFWNSIHLDYSTSIRADISEQNYSVCPRHWYIDATFQCPRCSDNFCFTTAEQKQWYEDQKFWFMAIPKQCKDCRRQIRKEKSLRREYDRNIRNALKSDDISEKQRLASVIDELRALVGNLPTAFIKSYAVLTRQITRKNDEGNA